jgi:hypothetical protein
MSGGTKTLLYPVKDLAKAKLVATVRDADGNGIGLMQSDDPAPGGPRAGTGWSDRGHPVYSSTGFPSSSTRRVVPSPPSCSSWR